MFHTQVQPLIEPTTHRLRPTAHRPLSSRTKSPAAQRAADDPPTVMLVIKSQLLLLLLLLLLLNSFCPKLGVHIP
eukprot:351479-Chlamydomonas_euryale.AAC.3